MVIRMDIFGCVLCDYSSDNREDFRTTDEGFACLNCVGEEEPTTSIDFDAVLDDAPDI